MIEPGPIAAPDLNEALDAVLDRPEFRWRARDWEQEVMDERAGSFLDALGKAVTRFFNWLEGWLQRLFGGANSGGSAPEMPGGGVDPALLAWVALAAALVVCLIAWLRNRRAQAAAVPGAAGVAAVDLSQEHLLASQLPEDEWLRLAREKQAAGETRLAVRAVFLAGLSFLGAHGRLRIARGKSNLDYLREYGRRGDTPEPARAAFGQNTRDFERVWYGDHASDGSLLDAMLRRYQTLRESA